MNIGFKIAACAVPLALILTGCGETNAEQLRKPDVIAKLLDAADGCPTISQYGSRDEHHARLSEILRGSDTVDMEAIAANGTTICLDKDLAHKQDTGWFNSRLVGVYHQSTNMARLWDDGDNFSDSFFTPSTITYGTKAVERLAGRFNDGKLGDAVAGRVSCGKSCTTTKWRNPGSFSGESDNVSILRPIARLDHSIS